MAAVVSFYHPTQEQYRTGLLVKCGDRWCHVVVFEPVGVHAVRISAEEETELNYLDHPLRRAVDQYRDQAARVGITEGARRLLDEAAHDVQPNKEPTP